MSFSISQEQADKIRKNMKAINKKYNFRQVEINAGSVALWEYIVINKSTGERKYFSDHNALSAKTKALNFAVESL